MESLKISRIPKAPWTEQMKRLLEKNHFLDNPRVKTIDGSIVLFFRDITFSDTTVNNANQKKFKIFKNLEYIQMIYSNYKILVEFYDECMAKNLDIGATIPKILVNTIDKYKKFIEGECEGLHVVEALAKYKSRYKQIIILRGIALERKKNY